MFIAIEGIDHTGKTALATHLYGRMLSLGMNITLVREPGSTPSAEKIRSVIMSEEVGNTGSAKTEPVLFAAARVDLVENVIRPALTDGGHVIADRFTASTWAYQHWGRGVDATTIAMLQYVATLGLQPDLTLYLYPTDITAVMERGTVDNRLDDMDMPFYTRVQSGYEHLYRNCWKPSNPWLVGRAWVGINANDPLDAVLQRGASIIDALLT